MLLSDHQDTESYTDSEGRHGTSISYHDCSGARGALIASLADFWVGVGRGATFGFLAKDYEPMGGGGALAIGDFVGEATVVYAAGGRSLAQAAPWQRKFSVGERSFRFAVDRANHYFGPFGRLRHIQLDTWLRGVKGSHYTFPRIPLP